MRKYIFRDYITTYKVLGINKFTTPESLAPCYMAFSFIFSIIIGAAKKTDSIENSVLTLLMYLPVFMIVVSSNLHPIRLSKMTHIVPLSDEEKYSYVKELLLFRIALYSIVAVVCNLVATVIAQSSPIAAVLNIFEAVLLASVVSPYRDGKKATFLVLLISGFFTSMILSAFPNELTTYIFAAAVMLLIQVPMIKGHIRNVQAELKDAVNYER